VRDADSFGRGHVPGAINIGLGGSFASWAGSLIPLGTPIVLVADDEAQIAEAAMRLARVGHEALVGALEGGVAGWARAGRPVAVLAQVSVDELARRLERGEPLALVDVRRPGEHDAGHIAGAMNLPLDVLPAQAQAIPADRPAYVICASGYRSSAAASLLLGRGHPQVINVPAGHAGWAAAGRPLSSKTA
jgi:hydroxyacylglutathione hydrolase